MDSPGKGKEEGEEGVDMGMWEEGAGFRVHTEQTQSAIHVFEMQHEISGCLRPGPSLGFVLAASPANPCGCGDGLSSQISPTSDSRLARKPRGPLGLPHPAMSALC